ncbi:hypothetical protein PRJ_5612 (plasmid) [Pseudomonas sp. XWY-1]|uniref:hypothetical protein n=1 Tax=Pseudomonas sp. XWY-1 TaxID=2069256 RepID=UPI000CDBBE78|nr:hypothetical protein [Pseudomonas sp. XWY-1]AUZ62170.1 hypothetical protein PRJ_5612 [Pseudomonas sp. XWY-1]
MEYLQYTAAPSARSADVRRMRAALANAGYMASENDIERLWDDYSFARRFYKAGWFDLPQDDEQLLEILLAGFKVKPVPYDDDDSIQWPSHW